MTISKQNSPPQAGQPHEGRVFVFGIDGAEPSLLRRFVDEGSLPSFARLLDRGVGAHLRSTPMPISPQAWASFATGLNPGRHSIFTFMDRIPGTFGFRPSNASHIQGASFWRLASEAGRRSAVLNVPMTFPAEPLNGLLVSGWLAPSAETDGFTHPPELATQLRERFGPYPLHAGIRDLAMQGQRQQALDAALSSMKRKADIAWHLWQQDTWDLFVFVVSEIDTIQHFLWPADGESGLDALRQAYIAADEILARWASVSDDDLTILVMSDHGAGLNPKGALYLPGLLEALGYTRRRSTGFSTLVAGAYRLVDRLLATRVKRRMAAYAPALHSTGMAAHVLGTIDWNRTRAYSYWAHGRADVWVNLAGRDPGGIVQPGDEYAELVAELCEVLLDCTDPQTGAPAVESAIPQNEAFHGPCVDAAPDIVVTFHADRVLSGLRCGDVIVTEPRGQDIHIGQHRLDGVFLASGPAIQPGTAPQAPNLTDLAPTILHLLGLSVPADLDGRLLSEILSADADRAQRVAPEPLPATERPIRDYSPEEEQAIRQRLRDLGYM